MPREDYEKVVPLMHDELAAYGIDVHAGGYYDNERLISRISFEYKALKTGAWMDIFPSDHVDLEDDSPRTYKILNDVNEKYRKYYRKHQADTSESDEKLIEKKKDFYRVLPQGNVSIYFPGMEFYTERCDALFKKEDIFPLKSIPFDKYSFMAPNHTDIYLASFYGKDFMSYPHEGVEHHTDADGEAASTRAARTGTDMNEVIQYLHHVAESISK